jgi:hypothetical protein
VELDCSRIRTREEAPARKKWNRFHAASLCIRERAQVDFYEAWADLECERTKVQVFTMRSIGSGAVFPSGLSACDTTGLPGAHE